MTDQETPWGYLEADKVHAEVIYELWLSPLATKSNASRLLFQDEPFVYCPEGGLLPHTKYAICIKVTSPTGFLFIP